MAFLNYTTSVDVDKSIAEIQRCLQQHGAMSILTDYDDQGYIIALSFKIVINGNPMGIRLPTDWRPVLEIMKQQGKAKKRVRTRYGAPKKNLDAENQAQAMRVAWRVTKDWVVAQMAIVETRMVTMPQIFLPYVVTRTGETFYQKILASGDGVAKLLE